MECGTEARESRSAPRLLTGPAPARGLTARPAPRAGLEPGPAPRWVAPGRASQSQPQRGDPRPRRPRAAMGSPRGAEPRCGSGNYDGRSSAAAPLQVLKWRNLGRPGHWPPESPGRKATLGRTGSLPRARCPPARPWKVFLPSLPPGTPSQRGKRLHLGQAGGEGRDAEGEPGAAAWATREEHGRGSESGQGWHPRPALLLRSRLTSDGLLTLP